MSKKSNNQVAVEKSESVDTEVKAKAGDLSEAVERQIRHVDTEFGQVLEDVKCAGERENTWGYDFLRGMLHLGEADVLGRFLNNREQQVERYGREYLALKDEADTEAKQSALNQIVARWMRAKDEVAAVQLAFEVRKLAAEKVTGKTYQTPKQRMDAANGAKTQKQSDIDKLAEYAQSLK